MVAEFVVARGIAFGRIAVPATSAVAAMLDYFESFALDESFGRLEAQGVVHSCQLASKAVRNAFVAFPVVAAAAAVAADDASVVAVAASETVVRVAGSCAMAADVGMAVEVRQSSLVSARVLTFHLYHV